MAKAIKFHDDFFESGALKYESGKHYPVNGETQFHAGLGRAEEVDVDEEEIEQEEVNGGEGEEKTEGAKSETKPKAPRKTKTAEKAAE